MKKSFVLILFVIFGLVAGSLQSANASQAPYKVICHHTPANQVTLTFQNQQSYLGHLGTPHNNQTFDTNGPCVTPTSTPTPTPTPTATPTPEPCHVNVFFLLRSWIPCPTLTPTETPTETPTPTVEPTATPAATTVENGNSNGSSQPRVPVCTVQITSPILQGQQRVSPTSVTFSWWAPQEGADYYAISYGYSADNLQYGQPKIDGNQTSITVNDLQPNTQVFAKVTAYKGACSSQSAVYQTIELPKGAPATGRGN